MTKKEGRGGRKDEEAGGTRRKKGRVGRMEGDEGCTVRNDG